MSDRLSGNVDLTTPGRAGAILRDAADMSIRFCSWKSNSHLGAGLAGETDIDLLVAPEDEEKLRDHLLSNGCIEVGPPPKGRHEGMTHFLGINADGTLFHLHIQDRLVLGQRYAKNYLLPLTGVFLDSPVMDGEVPRADPSVELVILACRSLLKYRIRDLIKDVLGIKTPGVPLDTIEEIEWCLHQTDRLRLEHALDLCGDVVPREVIRSFLEIVQSRPRSGLRLWRMKDRLERALSPFRRRPRVVAGGIYARALLESRLGLQKDPRLRLGGPGLSIAVVGADGSGKTTVSSELASWLGAKLAASRYYMGSKEPSRTTSASYMAFRVLRRSHRDTTSFLGDSAIRALIARLRDVMLAGHHMSVAKDRIRRLERARQDLEDGYVVILDRYPLEAVGNSSRIRLLDGPSIDGEAIGVVGKLAARESSLYADFELPDVILLLEVDPRVALERKPDHDFELVTEKTLGVAEVNEILQARGDGSRVHRIDANQPWPTPYEHVRAAVWESLSTDSG